MLEINPILRFELIRTARQRRHYLMRVLLALFPLCAIWVLYTWAEQKPMMGNQTALPVSGHLSRFADVIFLVLTWLQGLAILIMVPGLVAGSIAQEDRRGTMLHLLGTPLSSASVVFAKLAAMLFHAGIAVGVGLPLVFALVLRRALHAEIVLYAYAMLLALTIFTGSLSLLVAVVVRQPRRAIPAAYIFVGGWLLFPAWLPPITGRFGWPSPWLGVVEGWIGVGHPYEAARYLWEMPIAALFYPPNFAWARSGFLRAFPRFIGVQLFGSMVFLLVSALGLRPLRLGRWHFGGRDGTISSRPVMGDDPMMWKELHAPARHRRTVVRVSAIVLGALLFYPLIEPAHEAFQEWRASSALGADQVWRRGKLNESLRQLDSGLYCAGILAIAAVAATSVTGERERSTWTSLATTPITGREIARAKVWGALWTMRWLFIPFVVSWCIGLLTNAVHPLGVLAAAACLIIFVRYAAALGVVCSMLSSSSERAVAAVFMALVVSNATALLFMPLDLIGSLAGTRHATVLAGLTPFIEWASLVSPIEIQCWWAGLGWETRLDLPWLLLNARVVLDSGLMRTYRVSLAVHAIGTVVLLRVAAWSFDRHRDGPRRFSKLR